jgi:hypothetical protein
VHHWTNFAAKRDAEPTNSLIKLQTRLDLVAAECLQRFFLLRGWRIGHFTPMPNPSMPTMEILPGLSVRSQDAHFSGSRTPECSVPR